MPDPVSVDREKFLGSLTPLENITNLDKMVLRCSEQEIPWRIPPLEVPVSSVIMIEWFVFKLNETLKPLGHALNELLHTFSMFMEDVDVEP